jgi:hypothetical protein
MENCFIDLQLRLGRTGDGRAQGDPVPPHFGKHECRLGGDRPEIAELGIRDNHFGKFCDVHVHFVFEARARKLKRARA